MTEFAKYSSEYQIVSKMAHPSTPGVWRIKYRIYARNKGGVLTGRELIYPSLLRIITKRSGGWYHKLLACQPPGPLTS